MPGVLCNVQASSTAAVGSDARARAMRNTARRSIHHDLEHAGRSPALRLIIFRVPGREVAGKQTPGCACPHQPAQRVKHRAQIMPALASALGQEREARRNKHPFLSRAVRRVAVTVRRGRPAQVALASIRNTHWARIMLSGESSTGLNATSKASGQPSGGPSGAWTGRARRPCGTVRRRRTGRRGDRSSPAVPRAWRSRGA